MSLRKKIIFGFFISAFIIAILATFEYVNFIIVRNEMRFLEITDSVRSRTLQLRRHEKNFFLYPEKASEEAGSMRTYLSQLTEINEEVRALDPEKAAILDDLIPRYESEFTTIEAELTGISRRLDAIKGTLASYQSLAPLLEVTFRDKPLYVAGFLTDEFGLPPDDLLVTGLSDLETEIGALRDTGEDLVNAANELDRDARDNAESGIRQSQIAILIFFPLFLILGLGTLLYISTGVVRRMNTLNDSVERIGERFAATPPPASEKRVHKDEVDVLIGKISNMNAQLIDWEQELREKNEELLQSKKLAAIGTLASGVAHELNNPLNNISLSAQVLKRQVGEGAPAGLREIVDDIAGQTTRVKGIVGNLLEFAREREPQLREAQLNRLVESAYSQVSRTLDTRDIIFTLDSDPGSVNVMADPDQLERVFINLFTNAVSAMEGKGRLTVKIEREDGSWEIWVSDTGKGVPKEDLEKIFDPFFTRKDKGTGLGLAIVMNIIRKHNGDISVVSEEGMGTVFKIVLPEASGGVD